MYYKIAEDELFELIREAYRKGLHGEGTSNSVAEEIVRRHRDKIEVEPQETPPGYRWDLIMSPDMMSATDPETYIQEMGVPPPVVFGPGPITPDTPWRDTYGNFYNNRSRNEGSRKN